MLIRSHRSHPHLLLTNLTHQKLMHFQADVVLPVGSPFSWACQTSLSVRGTMQRRKNIWEQPWLKSVKWVHLNWKEKWGLLSGQMISILKQSKRRRDWRTWSLGSLKWWEIFLHLPSVQIPLDRFQLELPSSVFEKKLRVIGLAWGT